ncbi:tyrosine-protein phosphatase [Gloeobacter kilaueensis]|uniref:protein-tyrosine-phosphatase n=1 Tax=Gloeobacter kilaueensis (strain ATCC BAA-2537 / CCAP 1431/1 / ULC 316 / JS1) TaxID=1183438 RepID=U5QP91_GLOK1|nr:CpsB/CapC family capsule biosynthesis tyrosine phosphatase [Gloeobacter kilaueensis]AGY59394.1 capsular polysaccharide biosynthesis protein [Gloeobacter kilaueensis JS1]
MIDLHVHLVPGVDDGPKDWDVALALARKAYAGGIRTATITPHHMPGTYENTASQIQNYVRQLQAAYEREGIDIQLLPGQEAYPEGDLRERYERGELQTLADGAYLLVDLPQQDCPFYMEQLLFSLQAKGLMTLLAHPERNRSLRHHPERLEAMIQSGVRAVMSAGSMHGAYGPSAQKSAHDFLKRGLIQIVASDAHHPDGPAFFPLQNRPLVESLIGPDRAWEVMERNPQYVLDSKEIPAPLYDLEAEAGATRRKASGGGFWSRLFSRV